MTQQIIIPAPNGTYTVGQTVLQVTNTNSVQPFAPYNVPPVLELSVFYPTNSKHTVDVPYMPAEIALYEDVEQSQVFSLNTPNGTFERLSMQLAPNNTDIANSSTQWSVLLFGSAQGTNRNFYNAMISQIASTGYVVITYDTPYDTDIVLYSNGDVALLNETAVTADPASAAVADLNVRAQDASYILDQLTNTTFVSSAVPGCNQCLNTTHIGMFGHSIGGATAATTMLNDTRIAGALNFDGALWGDVVQTGLTRPFMLMTTEGQTRAAVNGTADASWSAIWPHLTTAAKFDLILNNSEHYTYSDYPLIFELLDILPATNATTLANLQLTTMNGTRAHHIVTTYATAFFDWLLKDGSVELLERPSPLFPEISVDSDTTTSNITAADGAGTGTGNGPATSASSHSSSAAATSTHPGYGLVIPALVVSMLCTFPTLSLT